MGRHKPRYKEITEKQNIKEVNEILTHEYGYDIYDFALSIAVILSENPLLGFWNIWMIQNKGIPYLETCKEEIKSLKAIRTKLGKIVYELDDHLKKIHYWDVIKGRNQNAYHQDFFPIEEINGILNKEHLTKKIYNLADTFRIIDEELDYFNNKIPPFKKRVGPPALPKIIIPSFWSSIMNDSKGPHWRNIKVLFQWFYNKLKTTDYSKHIKEYPEEMRAIYNFKRRFKSELEDDIKYFFLHNYHDYKKSSDVLEQKTIQIRFKKKNPEFLHIPLSFKEKRPELIWFPGGTTFPSK